MSEPVAYRRTIRPNRSLTRRAGAWLVIGIGAGAMALSVGALHLGAWPVLFFVAAELLGAGCIARWLRLHRRDYERVSVTEASVDIAQRNGHERICARFDRYWARVHVKRDTRLHAPRVLIASHGRNVEVGSALTEEAREKLAADLRLALRR